MQYLVYLYYPPPLVYSLQFVHAMYSLLRLALGAGTWEKWSLDIFLAQGVHAVYSLLMLPVILDLHWEQSLRKEGPYSRDELYRTQRL